MHNDYKVSDNEYLSQVDVVFCDSKEVLERAKLLGLNKNAIIKTSSPAVMKELKYDAHYIENFWDVLKMSEFQKSIYDYTNEIYQIVRNDKVFTTYAPTITLCSLFFNKIIFKAACLSKEDTDRSIAQLIPILPAELHKSSKYLVFPWKDIFHGVNTFKEFSFPCLGPDKRYFNAVKISTARKLMLNGWSGILYKLSLKLSRLPDFLFKEREILIGVENELLRDCAVAMFLKGYQLKKLNLAAAEKKCAVGQDLPIDTLLEKLTPVFQKRLKRWVFDAFHDNCLKWVLREIKVAIREQNSYQSYWANFLSSKDMKRTSFFFTGSPINQNLQALSVVMNNLRIPIIAFQHGISKEINAMHKEAAISYDNTTSDLFFTFNDAAKKISESIYSHRGMVITSGISSQHISSTRLLADRRFSGDILFLSTNLYRGNTNLYLIALNDYGLYLHELELLESVFAKIPHKVTYKSYPVDNLRYLDVDPLFDDIKKYPNIELLYQKIDSRYILGGYKIIVTTSATSTFSWAFFSQKPMVFIDYEFKAPFTPDAFEELEKSIFVFRYGEVEFIEKIRSFLSLPLDEIILMWNEKAIYRDNFYRKYISKFDNAGEVMSHALLKQDLAR